LELQQPKCPIGGYRSSTSSY